MKAKTILISIVLNFILNMVTYAQFNTIGRTEFTPLIKKKDHPRDKVSQLDSIRCTESNQDTAFLQVKNNSPLLVSLPLKSIKIGSRFGMRNHPIYHKKMMHNGVDLQARYEDVYSIFPGRVVKVGLDNRSGYYVKVQTIDYVISYCHLSKVYVLQGDFIEAGTPLALSGNSGSSTGPHLHLTVKRKKELVDPSVLLECINAQITSSNLGTR